MNPPGIGINLPMQQQPQYPPPQQQQFQPPQPQQQYPPQQYPPQQQMPSPQQYPHPQQQLPPPYQQQPGQQSQQSSSQNRHRSHQGQGGSHHHSKAPSHHHHQQPVQLQPGQVPSQGPPPPIQMQPSAQFPMGAGAGGQWFGQNADFANYLRNATSFHVKQSVELLEAFIGWESPNKYTIKDQLGNNVFVAMEESGCCNRQCCGKIRSFILRLRNMAGQDILLFERGLDCSCCCGLCCPDQLEARSASGQSLGFVTESFSILHPSWNLKDALGNVIFQIKGPVCACSICPGQSVDFVITSPANGQQVGKISKEWGGWGRELFTDADSFSVSFPADLDPSLKAVCLGALFLIDFEYFENSGNQPDSGHGRLFS